MKFETVAGFILLRDGAFSFGGVWGGDCCEFLLSKNIFFGIQIFARIFLLIFFFIFFPVLTCAQFFSPNFLVQDFFVLTYTSLSNIKWSVPYTVRTRK